MNHLNSVLLEGVTEGAPIFYRKYKYPEDEPPTVTNVLFSIRSRQRFADAEPVDTLVQVQVKGRQAKLIENRLTEGVGVRIVGRLIPGPEAGQLRLLAENIEFKPKLDQPPF